MKIIKMNNKAGFTVIELLIVIALLGAASVIFFVQKHQVEVAARDDARKTSINAMYYSLEEVYFKQHSSYPRTISSDVLTSVDPALFTDPNGKKLGDSDSNFRYEPLNCDGDACKSYVLRSTLEAEADFVKKSRA